LKRYILLAIGIFILTFSSTLGASLTAKLADLNGPHQINKITATSLNNADNSESQGNGSLSPEDMRRLAQFGLPGFDLAYSSETSAWAFYKDKQCEARVLGVNDSYNQFHQIDLKSGGFLTPGQEYRQVAVIDENLAQALFQNSNVVGLELELYGRQFKIIGVAEDDLSFPGSLTEPEDGTVYLPVETLLELNPNSRITSLEVETRDSGPTDHNTDILQTALAAIGQDAGSFKIIDYNLEYFLMEQKNRLMNFAAGAFALVLLFGLLKGRVQEIYHFIGLRLREKYFREVLQEDRAGLITGLAEILLLAGGMFVIWRLICFPFYLPPENMPHELKFSYLTDLLKSNIQAANLNTGYLAPPGEIRLDILKTIQNWNFVCNLFLGWPLLYLGLHLVNSAGEKLFKAEVLAGVFLLASLWLSIALLLPGKMPLAMDTKGVFLLFIALFLAVIVKGTQGHAPVWHGWRIYLSTNNIPGGEK